AANMQRQPVLLLNPEVPFVVTGMEHVAARPSGASITAKHSGRAEPVESIVILVRRLVEEYGAEHEGELDRYPLPI
ncbi:hypothetical protein, partial [Staphylococcus aureus]